MFKNKFFITIFFFALASASGVWAADKTYCVQVNYSAIPALVNTKKITLIVNVGTCASVAVTADGGAVTGATYSSSNQTATFSTTGSNITVTAVNWTAGGTGAATKATLFNDFHWAYSFTFDDNRQSQYTNGKPILDAHLDANGNKWRAASAAVGSWANQATSGNAYWMSWATLQTLRAAGWDILNHSMDHPNPLTCNGTATDIGTEVSQDQTLFQSHITGYNVTHLVFPYENSTANTCAGFPAAFLLSSECGGGSYNTVDASQGSTYRQYQRGGMFGTNDTAWKTLADQAAASANHTWLIEYTHGVAAGSGAPEDAYSTNVATLTDLLNHLDTTYGTAGNKSLWFAPASEVRDYLFTRDNAVVTVCTSAPTPTPTFTSTFTMTFTPTRTATPTFSSTPTATSTATRTNTPAFTNTNTYTATSTSTRTNTSTNTATNTFTNTPTSSNTTSLTPTSTNSSTNTSTRTFILTFTSTNTMTETFSATSTRTFTNTSTSTNTGTSTFTNTGTASLTPTPTSTGTPTNTSTRTFTPTNSLTNTSTSTTTPINTSTPMATDTNSSTSTLTSTSTRTLTSTSSPTATSTDTPSATFASTTTHTFTATNTSTSTGTSTPTTTPTSTNTFSSTPTSTFTSTKSSTPTSTNTFTATSTFTSSSTPTFTHTATSTSTSTRTFTATPTPTSFSTATSTFTITATSSSTRTATTTPKGTPTPIIFPNPAPGPTVNILPPPYSGPSFVRVEIFTLAFRKVLDRFFYNIPSGVSVQVNLADRWGSPLASGIYYVVVTTSSGRSIGKLLILR